MFHKQASGASECAGQDERCRVWLGGGQNGAGQGVQSGAGSGCNMGRAAGVHVRLSRGTASLLSFQTEQLCLDLLSKFS